MGKLLFSEAVDVGDEAVEFGAELGALAGVGDGVGVAAEADNSGQVVEFGGGADELGGMADNGLECRVFLCEAGHSKLIEIEIVKGRCYFLAN